MRELPIKQVHLDFHTSEHCPDVGSLYDSEDFKAALKLGRLDSITVFAKCHHGWCYYPSQADKQHPTMKPGFDMLGAMIDDAHAVGVRAPVYVTVGWSHKDAQEHPEWIAKDRDGRPIGGTELDGDADRPDYLWYLMCINSGYEKLVYAVTRELVQRYGGRLDGLFYDICFQGGVPCYCDSCVAGMREAGIDIDDAEAASRYSREKWMAFQDQCRDIVLSRLPEATIFFNNSANRDTPHYYTRNTHIEMEDLPTSWGGYDKLPARAKHFAKTGMDYLGMTGKFHKNWGEFGGFKHPDALKYELASMLMYGAKCSVGDQMHPLGFMERETYRIIGEAYSYVDEIKDYCYGLRETTTLALIDGGAERGNEGIQKILLENQLDFDVISNLDDISRYECLIIPEGYYPDGATAEKLNAFIAAGGGLLFCHDACLGKEKKRFLIDAGVEYAGESPFEMDYLKAGERLADNMVNAPFKCYSPALRVTVRDAAVLAEVYEPYFRRTVARFNGHVNAPFCTEPSAYPGAVQKGNVVYLAHNIGTQYAEHGLRLARDFFVNALRLVYKNPVLTVSLPSAGRARLAMDDKRYVLHLTYAQPIQRGSVLVIEDMPKIDRIPVKIRTDRVIGRVYTVPQKQPLAFTQKDGSVTFTVQGLRCHQIIALDYV